MADEWVRNSEQMSSSQEFMLKYLQILMCWSIKCLKCLTILNKHNFTKWLYYDFHDFKTLIMRVRARRERKKAECFIFFNQIWCLLFSVSLCLCVDSEVFFVVCFIAGCASAQRRSTMCGHNRLKMMVYMYNIYLLFNLLVVAFARFHIIVCPLDIDKDRQETAFIWRLSSR